MRNFQLSNRQDLRDLRDSLETLINLELSQTNLQGKIGNMRFESDGSNVTMKLTIQAENADGKIEPQHVIDFHKNAERFGFKKTDLGRPFTLNGNLYTLVGMKTRSRKYPMIAANTSGKRFKFTAYDISLALQGHTPSSLAN